MKKFFNLIGTLILGGSLFLAIKYFLNLSPFVVSAALPTPIPSVSPLPPGEGDGEGRLTVTTNPSFLTIGTTGVKYTFTFTAGAHGIKPGGFIVVNSFPFDFSQPVEVNSVPSRVTTELSFYTYQNNYNCQNNCLCLRGSDAPFNPTGTPNLLKIRFPNGLPAGNSITFVHKNVTISRHPQYENVLGISQAQRFHVWVDGDGDCHASPFPDINSFPSVLIYPQGFFNLEVVLPSAAFEGEPIKVIVKAKDKFGNIANAFQGKINLSTISPNNVYLENLPTSYTFTSTDEGIHIFSSIVPRNSGMIKVKVELDTAATNFPYTRGESNPLVVISSQNSSINLPKKIFWGDLHAHTFISDGRFSLYKFYNDAQKRASLDFAVATDHSGWISSEEWNRMNVVANRFTTSDFVAIPAYEFTCNAAGGGQRNIYFENLEGPVFVCNLPDLRERIYVNPYEQVEGVFISNTGELFSEPNLSLLLRANALTIPHHVSWETMGVNWEQFNPQLDRVVEIYSEHGSGEYYNNPLHHKFQPADPVLGNLMTVQAGLAKGFRFGFVGGSDDHHHTMAGGPRPPESFSQCMGTLGTKLCYKGGFTAVLSSSLSRTNLLGEIRARHTYATTGERIFVYFAAETGGRTYLMGDELRSFSSPRFVGVVYGTNSLEKVEIVKGKVLGNNYNTPFPVVYSQNTRGQSISFSWKDPNFDESAFYYLRVTQAHSEDFPLADYAWSSPIWVDKLSPATLRFSFKSQGISSQQPNKTVRVVLKQGGEEKYRFENVVVSCNASGIYQGEVTGIAPGRYDVFLKGWVHLQKKFPEVELNSGENIKDWSGEQLWVGDFNNDNILDQKDLDQFLERYTGLIVPVSSNNRLYDVNGDGVVSLKDIALVLVNYVHFQIPGD